jgi:hypothetical protein
MSMDPNEYGMAVEPEGVPVHKILAAGVTIFGTIAIAVIFLFPIYNRGVQQASFDASVETVAYPAIRDAEMASERRITQFEVLDQTAGVYQLPVDVAMELLVEERRAVGAPVSDELPDSQ